MSTKRDLKAEIERFNGKYAKTKKNHLVISQAYGGYQIGVQGEKSKKPTYQKIAVYDIGGNKIGVARVKRYEYRGIGSGFDDVTCGYPSADVTLRKLEEVDEKGYVKNKLASNEKRRW